jgi:16S rRNA (guanine(966)-N(2))-methyltransferase RsmD
VRIIAGTAGGRSLKAPRGSATRPTADRVREAIFNILVARGPVPRRVLDLYAGSGALGLEALSRGAESALFVDESGAACATVRDNARALGLTALCQVIAARAGDWLRGAAVEPFGWVFLDPPYAEAGRELGRTLALLDERRLLAPGGVAVAEHDWRDVPGDRVSGLLLSDSRRYGQTGVSFFTNSEEALHEQ